MDAFIGEVRAFAFGFIPENWLPCYGQIVQGRQYQALFALLGTTYGGDINAQTFGLPNLQSKAMIGVGTGPGLTPRVMTKTYGSATVAITSNAQIGAHNHAMNAMATVSVNLTNNAQSTPESGKSWLAQVGNVIDATHLRNPKAYLPSTTAPTSLQQFHPMTIGVAGGNTAGGVDSHANTQPYLSLVMCICWNGMFPNYN